MEKIIIWGSGGQGKVVLDILRQGGNFDISGFIDSNPALKGKFVDGVEILGDKYVIERLKKIGVSGAIVAIGDNKARRRIADYLKEKGFHLVNAVHPRAIIASNVIIGNDVTVAAGAIICAHAIINDNVIINTGAIVEHEDIIGKDCHVAPGAKLAGSVKVGEKTFVGIGAVIIECLEIGSNSIIGAGAIVINDIPNNVLAVGVPAKVIKKLSDS